MLADRIREEGEQWQARGNRPSLFIVGATEAGSTDRRRGALRTSKSLREIGKKEGAALQFREERRGNWEGE